MDQACADRQNLAPHKSSSRGGTADKAALFKNEETRPRRLYHTAGEPGTMAAGCAGETGQECRRDGRAEKISHAGLRSSPAPMSICPSATPPIPAAHRPRAAFTIPRSTRIPAASASSPILRDASRTRSSTTASPFCSISSIAARLAPTRAWAMAPASWCRSRTNFLQRKPPGLASSCRSRANMGSAICSCRRT